MYKYFDGQLYKRDFCGFNRRKQNVSYSNRAWIQDPVDQFLGTRREPRRTSIFSSCYLEKLNEKEESQIKWLTDVIF